MTVAHNGVAQLLVDMPLNSSGLTVYLQALQFNGPGDGVLTQSLVEVVQ